MASQVIKRDGSKVAFDGSKVRSAIQAAAAGTGLSEEQAQELAQEVGDIVIDAAEEKETISTLEIRAMTLDELDRVAPQVSAAWRAYDERKK